MLGSGLPYSDSIQYPRFVENTKVIYLDQDQEADLILTGFVQLNDFSFRLILKSQCLSELQDIATKDGIIALGISHYYLLTV